MRTFSSRALAALTSGTVLLTACSGSDSAGPAPCSVTGVSLSNPPASIEVGASATLSANITQQNCSGLSVSWTSSNTAVATVSGSGEVVGVTAGPATITASVSGKTATANITVVPPTVATVAFTLPYTNITVTNQTQLSATAKDGRGNVLAQRTVTWSSSNSSLVSVSPAGVMTGVALGGPVDITATSEGKSTTVQVTVVPRYAYSF